MCIVFLLLVCLWQKIMMVFVAEKELFRLRVSRAGLGVRGRRGAGAGDEETPASSSNRRWIIFFFFFLRLFGCFFFFKCGYSACVGLTMSSVVRLSNHSRATFAAGEPRVCASWALEKERASAACSNLYHYRFSQCSRYEVRSLWEPSALPASLAWLHIVAPNFLSDFWAVLAEPFGPVSIEKESQRIQLRLLAGGWC